MNKTSKVIILQIIGYTLICLSFLYWVEQVWMTPYLLKTLIKLPMFLGLPLLIYKYQLGLKITMTMSKDSMKIVGLIAFGVFAIILIAYAFLNSAMDMQLIGKDFSERMELTQNGVIAAGIYTIFVNSFIEELFFRGFIFQGLEKSGLKKASYILSSLAFALYHVSNFKTWFNPWLMMLVIFGLFVGGMIFAYFVKRTESFLASWLIHLSADLAIILIGFKILGIY